MNVRVSTVHTELAMRPGLEAAEYVDSCLALANWRSGDSLNALLTIPSVLMTADSMLHQSIGNARHGLRVLGPDNNEQVLDQDDVAVKGGEALHRRLGKVLKAFRQDREVSREKWRAMANVACRSIAVHTTLRIAPDGTLRHLHRYIPRDQTGVEGLLLAFLLDPARPAGGPLKVCTLSGCGAFFIARKRAGRGGRVRIYCTAEHQKAADKIRARVRARRQRELQRGRRRAKIRVGAVKR